MSIFESLEKLQKKLIDLSGYNRLINFKHSKARTLRLTNSAIQNIYDRLVVQGKSIVIKSLPEPERRDYEKRNGRDQRPEESKWAERNNLSLDFELPLSTLDGVGYNIMALQYEHLLATKLRKIEREARLAIEETGSNMLFLILGFLEYPDRPDGDKLYLAPLVCLPITINKERIHNRISYSIEFTGEDISDNLSLSKKLEDDYDITFPGIPEDEINFENYFSSIENIIKSKKDFFVRSYATIGLLSYSNMLLYKDLEYTNWQSPNGGNKLLNNEVIKQIFTDNYDNEAHKPLFIDASKVEEESGDEIPLIFNADSSQHIAIMEIIHNKSNVVIEGPPGTGKSQTIANLLAACLKKGLKVLFVSEKLAALQVVRKRLEDVGLGIFTLELHSNKTSRAEVLKDLNRRISVGSRFQRSNDFGEEDFKRTRRSLNEYNKLIQNVECNQLGLSIYSIVWKREFNRQKLIDIYDDIKYLEFNDAHNINRSELNKRKEKAKIFISDYGKILKKRQPNPFIGLDLETFELADTSNLLAKINELKNTATNLIELLDTFNNIVQVTFPEYSFIDWMDLNNEISKLYSSLLDHLPYQLTTNVTRNGALIPETISKLQELKDYIGKINKLQISIDHCLVSDEYLEYNKINEITELAKSLDYFKIGRVPIHEILERSVNLFKSSKELEKAICELNTYLNRNSFYSITSVNNLNNLKALLDHITNINTSFFKYQSYKFASISNVQELNTLISEYKNLERQWNQLNNFIYLDIHPKINEVKHSISVLRRGNKWYRIFDYSWQKALRYHKHISKSNKYVTPESRLKDLELLHTILNDIHRFNTSNLISEYFPGFLNPFEEVDFHALSHIIDWNLKFNQINKNVINAKPTNININEIKELKDIAEIIRNKTTTIYDLLRESDLIFENKNIINEETNFITFHLETNKIESWFRKNSKWITNCVDPKAKTDTLIESIESYFSKESILKTIDNDIQLKEYFGDELNGVETNIDQIDKLLKTINRVSEYNIDQQLIDFLLSNNLKGNAHLLNDIISKIFLELSCLEQRFEDISEICNICKETFKYIDKEDDKYKGIVKRCDTIINHINDIELYESFSKSRAFAIDYQLIQVVNLVERGLVTTELIDPLIEYMLYNGILTQISSTNGIIKTNRYRGIKSTRDDFRTYDKELLNHHRFEVFNTCLKNFKNIRGNHSNRVADRTEMSLINYLLPQRRPRITVRNLIKNAPRSLLQLKPCFMMGPQAVAQYLAPDKIEFDIVVMDEASQLKPEFAIGAIARGKQLVVVGDSNQLPPTSFFNRLSDEVDEEEITIAESESILDLCRSQFRTIKKLLWHYRSQHHSLIAFSNSAFYNNDLLVFPSPHEQNNELGLSAIYVKDAVYENQVNKKEAIHVADLLINHMRTNKAYSIGVVTLNVKQKELISEIFETKKLELVGEDDLWKHWENKSEPIFIKNLENVQGDERDYIIISTTFGKAPNTNVVRQNFGPISKPNGWRRLNVLFTRARRSITVVTSLLPSDIVVDSATHDGAKVLQNYLNYIQTGVLLQGEDTGYEPDSDFERAIINLLNRYGFDVTPQLGVAGFRIDIAVKHPVFKNTYIAAIECDGATYHSSKTARDRDRIRQEILESLGWKDRIWRIWSTDWFKNPNEETERLLEFLKSIDTTGEYSAKERTSWITIPENSFDLIPSSSQNYSESIILDNNLLSIDESYSLLEEIDVVEIGDTIIYKDVNTQDDNLEVTITLNKSNPEKKLISRESPLSVILLGSSVGDKVTLKLNNGREKVFEIIEIRKPDRV